MKARLDKFINKYKNKIVSVCLSFLVLPLFSLRTSAAFSYDGHNVIDVLDGASLYGVESFDFSNTDFDNVAKAFVSDSAFCFLGNKGQTVAKIGNCLIPKESKVLVTLTTLEYVTNSGDYTLRVASDDTISRIQMYLVNLSGSYTLRTFERGNSSFSHYGSRNTVYFVHNSPSEITSFEIVINNDKTANNPPYQTVQPVYILNVYALPNNATEESILAFQSKVDWYLGKIVDGTTSSQNTVDENKSAVSGLNSVVTEYQATEQQFFNDFNSNQQAITTDIVGWSWGGLVNCADWVGSTLTDYYNNMGDFRQYIIYPLMLGIALFFLGRGGSIIGHLFRKPTVTTVNTKSVFSRVGNTRYTTTTTSRQGGVWRK